MGEIGFPLRLRIARLAKGWTQYELADRAGLSQGTISHFELGRREPGMRTAMALAHALDVEMAQLFPPHW